MWHVPGGPVLPMPQPARTCSATCAGGSRRRPSAASGTPRIALPSEDGEADPEDHPRGHPPDPQDRSRVRAQRASGDRGSAPLPLPLAARLGRVVRVHAGALGRGPINFERTPRRRRGRWPCSTPGSGSIELQPHYSWIIDRFHLSARAFQQLEHGRDVDFGSLEERLRALDVHLVLCTRARGHVGGRPRRNGCSSRGTRRSTTTLTRLRREQELLRELASESRSLPVLELDTSDGDIEGRLPAGTRRTAMAYDRRAAARGEDTQALDAGSRVRDRRLAPIPVTPGTHAHLRMWR